MAGAVYRGFFALGRALLNTLQAEPLLDRREGQYLKPCGRFQYHYYSMYSPYPDHNVLGCIFCTEMRAQYKEPSCLDMLCRRTF